MDIEVDSVVTGTLFYHYLQRASNLYNKVIVQQGMVCTGVAGPA